MAATPVLWEDIVRLQEHKDFLYVQQELINQTLVLSRLQIVRNVQQELINRTVVLPRLQLV